MPKYIFKKLKEEENPYDVTTVTLEVDSDLLTDVVEAFQEFLMGAGFPYIKEITYETRNDCDCTDTDSSGDALFEESSLSEDESDVRSTNRGTSEAGREE